MGLTMLEAQAAGKALDFGIEAGNELIMGDYYRDKEAKQHQKLLNQQTAAQEKLMTKQREEQLTMWNATNYGAQVAHLQAAGLNPALMYGTGGGGGSTTAGTVSSGQATGQGPGRQQLMDNTAKLDMAALKVAEAQADKLQAEADSIRGKEGTIGEAQINEAQQRTNLLVEQTGNENLKRTNTDLQNQILAIEKEIKEKTKNFEINTVKEKWFNVMAQTDKFTSETAGLNIENSRKAELINSQINNLQASTANLIAAAYLNNSQKTLTDQEIKNFNVKINNILADTKNKDIAARIKQVEAAAAETIGQPIGTSGMIGEVIKQFMVAWGQTQQNIANTLDKLFSK